MSTIAALIAAVAALLGASLPAQADLTGPKPPSNNNGVQEVAPADGHR